MEILDNLSLLKLPVLNTEDVTLAGVSFATPAHLFPANRVVEVSLHPRVAWSCAVSDGSRLYYDACGEQIEFNDLIDGTIDAGGVLHFHGGVSFKFQDRRIVQLSLYGKAVGFVAELTSYDEVLSVFGCPTYAEQQMRDGRMAGYDNYYAGSRKWVLWDALCGKVTCIRLQNADMELLRTHHRVAADRNNENQTELRYWLN